MCCYVERLSKLELRIAWHVSGPPPSRVSKLHPRQGDLTLGNEDRMTMSGLAWSGCLRLDMIVLYCTVVARYSSTILESQIWPNT